MKRILLVEDEPVILKALRRLLERNHYEVQCATTVEEALAAQPHTFDLVLTDLRLPGDPGTVLITAAEPVPVVIMTSHASVRSAVDAMRHGAMDYIAKPFDHDELLLVIERSLQQNLLLAQNRALKLTMDRWLPVSEHIEGTELDNILQAISENEQSYRYLHLHGENGTNKELLARAIHTASHYKDGPFLVFDVSKQGSAANNLLSSAGQSPDMQATANASENSVLPSGGYLQAAQNGTLVIRHPELLSSDTQQAFVEVVAGSALGSQNNMHQRVANVALICLSNSSIELLMEQAQLTENFAELFLTRQFEVAPLRQRPADIITLARRHMTRLETRYAKQRMTLSDDAIAALMAGEWPGNVSEMEGVLEKAVLQCRTRTITLTDLGISSEQSETGEQVRDLSIDEYFRFFVIRNQNNLSETELAARLGISRKALWERRQKMNLLRDTIENLSS